MIMELNPFVVGVIAIGIIILGITSIFYYNLSKMEKEIN
jgi:hypothetical protein